MLDQTSIRTQRTFCISLKKILVQRMVPHSYISLLAQEIFRARTDFVDFSGEIQHTAKNIPVTRVLLILTKTLMFFFLRYVS